MKSGGIASRNGFRRTRIGSWAVQEGPSPPFKKHAEAAVRMEEKQLDV